MIESIKLNDKDYPIRFDFRALKEFKALTGDDVLLNFDTKSTDHIITLTFTALKSGHFFTNPNATDFLNIEEVSRLLSIRDMKKVVIAFINEVGVLSGNEKSDSPGEIHGTA